MDMYRDAYAIAVMINGKVQKEVDNTVVMPFGTEYIVRLKNKQRKRAIADVHIDGRLAAKGIVVDANGTVDLERFVVDGNLLNGPRFKIVPTSDGRVEQADEIENGILEVRFYSEKDKPEVKVVEHHEYNHQCLHNFIGHCRSCCWNWNCPICHPYKHWNHTPYYDGGMWGSSGSAGLSNQVQCSSTTTDWHEAKPDEKSSEKITRNDATVSAKSFTMTNSGNAQATVMNCSSMSMPMNSCGDSQVGATVQGSQSNQKFTTISLDVDYDHPVTLQLKLRGVTKIIDTCGCGYKRKSERFCPNCGTELAIGIAA